MNEKVWWETRKSTVKGDQSILYCCNVLTNGDGARVTTSNEDTMAKSKVPMANLQ